MSIGYTVDPYSARALILKLELENELRIRVLDTPKYTMICIDKEAKHGDTDSADEPE